MEIGKIEIIRKNVESAQAIKRKLVSELEEVRSGKRQWSHLSYAFGPKAIQSIEIDSAGPGVSDIINNLLVSCFGTRFAIRMVTQKLKADKSGMKDFFDMEVIDSDNNRILPIGDLSGGERVICGEAISLGIALYNSYKGGIKWNTLYRDECSGALSPKNSVRYINMLRKAMDLGNFSKCFFIAQQPDLVDMADNVIYISNGSVRIK